MTCELSSMPMSSGRYLGNTSIRALMPWPGIFSGSRQGERTNPIGETTTGRSAERGDIGGATRGCLLTGSRVMARTDLGNGRSEWSPPASPETLERARTPEAGRAGHLADVAVLFEVAVRHVVAQREVAVIAGREVVRLHVSAEHAPLVRVPGVEDPPV